MSYLRDAKIIKSIAESNNCSELSEEACRYILANTELVVRRIIIDSIKYSKKFNHAKLKSEDIDIALNDLNLAFLLFGLSRPATNSFVPSDRGNLELDQQEMCIKDAMQDIVANRLTKKKKIGLNFDWLSIEGKLNPMIESTSTIDSLAGAGAEQRRGYANHISPFGDILRTSQKSELINFDYLSGKSSKNIFLVKELNPNVLTKEAASFFDTFRKILEDYFQLIDQRLVEVDTRRFYHGDLTSSGCS